MKNYSVTKKVSFDLDDDAENGLALGNYLLNNDFIDILADNDKNSRRRGAAAAVAVMLLLMLLAGVAFWLYRLNKEADEVLKAANEQVLVQEDTFEEHSESEPLLPSFEYTVTDKGFIRIYTKPEDLGGEDSGRAFHPGACIYPLAVYVDTCSGEEWHSFEYDADGYLYTGWINTRYLTQEPPAGNCEDTILK